MAAGKRENFRGYNMKQNDLTTGNIIKKITLLAMPIMGTSFLQTAFNLIDMVWIGRLGSDSVAAVGTSGYFMWFSMALIALGRIGTEVGIAQSIGAKNVDKANENISTSMLFTFALSITYMLVLIFGRHLLIGFFNLNAPVVEGYAKDYLSIVALGMPFAFMNMLFSGIYNGAGQSATPFRINSVGLVLNMILDPLFIFGLSLGVKGAAYATIISQFSVTALFALAIIQHKLPYRGFSMIHKPSMQVLKTILKISLPVSLQNGLFTILAMFVARIIALHGTTAIAVQRVGTQVEAISYMTASGFGAALSAFVGQNLGAGKTDRIKKGFKSAGQVMTIIGIITSLTLFVFAKPIFSLFITEEPALSMGITYLRILSVSQLFMCIEITFAGGMNGLSKSLPPAVVSVVFNALRIPSAYFLSVYTVLGLNGVWWSISISSVIKGTVLTAILIIVLRKMQPQKELMTP